MPEKEGNDEVVFLLFWNWLISHWQVKKHFPVIGRVEPLSYKLIHPWLVLRPKFWSCILQRLHLKANLITRAWCNVSHSEDSSKYGQQKCPCFFWLRRPNQLDPSPPSISQDSLSGWNLGGLFPCTSSNLWVNTRRDITYTEEEHQWGTKEEQVVSWVTGQAPWE